MVWLVVDKLAFENFIVVYLLCRWKKNNTEGKNYVNWKVLSKYCILFKVEKRFYLWNYLAGLVDPSCIVLTTYDFKINFDSKNINTTKIIQKIKNNQMHRSRKRITQKIQHKANKHYFHKTESTKRGKNLEKLYNKT